MVMTIVLLCPQQPTCCDDVKYRSKRHLPLLRYSSATCHFCTWLSPSREMVLSFVSSPCLLYRNVSASLVHESRKYVTLGSSRLLSLRLWFILAQGYIVVSISNGNRVDELSSWEVGKLADFKGKIPSILWGWRGQAFGPSNKLRLTRNNHAG